MTNCEGDVIFVVTKRDTAGAPTQAAFEYICTNGYCCIGLEPAGSCRRIELTSISEGKVDPLEAQKPGKRRRLRQECHQRQQAPNN